MRVFRESIFHSVQQTRIHLKSQCLSVGGDVECSVSISQVNIGQAGHVTQVSRFEPGQDYRTRSDSAFNGFISIRYGFLGDMGCEFENRLALFIA